MSTKYTKVILEDAVRNSVSFAGVLRHLGLKQAGGTQSYLSKRIKYYGIDYSHFTGSAWNRGKPASNRKLPEDILVVLPKGSLRPKREQLYRAMIEMGMEYKCSCGQLPVWNGKPLTIEIDHKDGDWLNNKLDNLRFLCGHCHSQEVETNRSWKTRLTDQTTHDILTV